jgi:hypothetical protein
LSSVVEVSQPGLCFLAAYRPRILAPVQDSSSLHLSAACRYGEIVISPAAICEAWPLRARPCCQNPWSSRRIWLSVRPQRAAQRVTALRATCSTRVPPRPMDHAVRCGCVANRQACLALPIRKLWGKPWILLSKNAVRNAWAPGCRNAAGFARRPMP